MEMIMDNTACCIMAKKSKKDLKKNPEENAQAKDEANSAEAGESPAALQEKAALEKLPKDVQEKLKAIKAKLEKFQKKILEKFEKYIVGVALLPPPKPDSQEQPANNQQPAE